jgi:hypothetical protein
LYISIDNYDPRDPDSGPLISFYTDELHLELHRLIAMFNLSDTPGHELQPGIFPADRLNLF